MSATDIDKGTRWREEVAAALDTMKAGIICLTPENLREEWLLFEAGALSKMHDPKTRVWTYLLADLKAQHLRDPLAMFQATTADKEDTRKLVHSINKNLDATLPESSVNHWFDKSWPDLREKLAFIFLLSTEFQNELGVPIVVLQHDCDRSAGKSVIDPSRSPFTFQESVVHRRTHDPASLMSRTQRRYCRWH